ncbi:unnamed protein product [Vitrella brassicaformis CCMP3155]|uniref:Glycosyltransferase 61 catalytic domain-containing protein n=2 Tax=Vitrella brassicaformis TaxID=1169539 RepID=A0A0G4GZR5_VITBC|nr:unnamed protein product [Vitrella brassicaformis CCMP3155]|eukprot:CEM36671.1 unnamed protein product [Vitrella brassicaformis CCMP3155]
MAKKTSHPAPRASVPSGSRHPSEASAAASTSRRWLRLVGMAVVGVLIAWIYPRLLQTIKHGGLLSVLSKYFAQGLYAIADVGTEQVRHLDAIRVKDEIVTLKLLSHPSDLMAAPPFNAAPLDESTVFHTAVPIRRSPARLFDESGRVGSSSLPAKCSSDATLEQPRPSYPSIRLLSVDNVFASYEGIVFNRNSAFSSPLFQDMSGLFSAMNLHPHRSRPWMQREAFSAPVSHFLMAALVRMANRTFTMQEIEEDGLYDEIGYFSSGKRSVCVSEGGGREDRRSQEPEWLRFPTVELHEELVQGLFLYSINYYHWTTEGLPLLLAVRPLLLRSPSVKLLVYDRPFVREALGLLAIPQRQIVFYNPCRLYYAWRLYTTTVREASVYQAASTLNATRTHMLATIDNLTPTRAPEEEASHYQMRRILLVNRLPKRGTGAVGSHQNDRIMMNLDGVRGVVERVFADQPGAVVVDVLAPETVGLREQMERFNQADLVIGVEGAALSNILYCREGTRVLNIIPIKGIVEGYGEWDCGQEYYWNMAESLKLPYWALVLRETAFSSPVTVPLDALESVLMDIRFAAIDR